MITGIKIGLTVYKTTQNLKGGYACGIVGKNNTALIYADVSSSSGILTSGIVTSIQGESPDLSGLFYVLGDLCTSITGKDDTTDIASIPLSNTLTVYDGCSACTSCQKYAQLKNDIQLAFIWISGMKDCQLYNDTGALMLWKSMLSKLSSQKEANCPVVTSITEDTRKQEFGRAIQLLYQYKAAVAMWNYIVFHKARSLQIVPATEDYGGFIVLGKRIIDMCAESDAQSIGLVILTFKVNLQSGQTTLPTNWKIFLYIQKLPLNCYIEYGTDTGALQGAHIDDADKVRCTILSDSQTPSAVLKCIFTPEDRCKAVFSGAFKILPVIVDTEPLSYTCPIQDPANLFITLPEFVKARPYATDINLALQQATNRWCVESFWLYKVGSTEATLANTVLTRYYTTGYSKHPEDSLS